MFAKKARPVRKKEGRPGRKSLTDSHRASVTLRSGKIKKRHWEKGRESIDERLANVGTNRTDIERNRINRQGKETTKIDLLRIGKEDPTRGED